MSPIRLQIVGTGSITEWLLPAGGRDLSLSPSGRELRREMSGATQNPAYRLLLRT